MRIALIIGLLAGFAAFAGASPPAVTVETAPFDAAMSRLAIDADGDVHLIFRRQRETNLSYTRRDADAEEFTEPLIVNSIPDSAGSIALAVTDAGVPHVFFTASGAYIRQQIGDRKITPRDIRHMFHTRLEGDAFTPQQDLAGPTWGFEFTGTIALRGEDDVALFWQGTTKPGGEAVREVFRAASTDGGRTFSDVEPAFSGKGACVCCFMQAHVDADGRLLLAYRAAVDGDQRDTYLLTSDDMGSTLRASNVDPWRVAMCPASSYAFAEAPDATWMAWETEGRVFCGPVDSVEVSKTIDAPPTPGPHKRPTIAANHRGEILLAWSEGNDLIRWTILDADGEPMLDVPGSTRPMNRRWPAPMAYATPTGDFVIIY